MENNNTNKGINRIASKGDIIEKGTKQGLIERYDIELDKAKVFIEILRGVEGVTYNLHVPEIGIATASLLSEIRNELVSVTTISMGEMIDPASLGVIKKRFMKEAVSLFKEKIPTIDPEMQEFLVGKLMQDMLGLGEIEFLVT